MLGGAKRLLGFPTPGDGAVEGWGDVWRVGRHSAGFPVRLQELFEETDKVHTPPA
jgi:hypothetical protein